MCILAIQLRGENILFSSMRDKSLSRPKADVSVLFSKLNYYIRTHTSKPKLDTRARTQIRTEQNNCPIARYVSYEPKIASIS